MMRRARQVTQILALLVFMALLLATRGGQFPAVPPSLFFKLDPLAMLASTIAKRQWVSGVALGGVTLLATLALGRVWCGWVCPLGTVLDLFGPRKPSRLKATRLERWRAVKYILLIGIVGAAMAANLTLLTLDPISTLTRGLAAFVLPGLNQALLGAERALYNIESLQSAIDWFEMSVRAPLFSADVWHWWNVLPGLLLIAVIALNAVAERFWCRYLCPLGGLLGLISRVALVRRVVSQAACRQCARCARACPTDTIDPNQDYASDPAECTVCLDCLPQCPSANGQSFSLVRQVARPQSYDPSRRQVIGAMGTGLGAAAIYSLLPARLRRLTPFIRPPGAQAAHTDEDNAFLAACIRCGECIKVCPTGGLQPALLEASLDGWWTPILIPRLGYCDYSCHACGQVCPTGAISNLSLQAKRAAIIGKAELDRTRCLPWRDNIPCIVCEEMCPLAPKAIKVDTFYITDPAGQMVEIQRPHVIQDRCIGCGICEFRCPVQGPAAIQVTGKRF